MATFIYKPKGKAAEYGDYALNIYTGCPHQCFYCYSPSVLRRDKDIFHGTIRPRDGILEGVRNQLLQNGFKNKLIHLCFVCDPYPNGCDNSITREIIRIIKGSGNHVQILTKNGKDAMRDFDLLDEHDWFGITYAGYDGLDFQEDYIPDTEPGSGSPYWRIQALYMAKKMGIHTWVSCEPVLNANAVLEFIEDVDYVDKWKIGKLNYYPSSVDWKEFGHKVESILINKQKRVDCEYYIKESLRELMQYTSMEQIFVPCLLFHIFIHII